jgi:hypothetical protein
MYSMPHGDRGDIMIEAIVFVISFILFLLISLVKPLPQELG